MTSMLSAFTASIDASGFSTIGHIDLPIRKEQIEPTPSAFLEGHVGRWLSGSQFAGRLWTHQAKALRHYEAGANVVVSTGTASGKSLVYQAAALRMLDQYPDDAALVFYPLKALVADQLVSWRTVMNQIACRNGIASIGWLATRLRTWQCCLPSRVSGPTCGN